MSEYYGIGSRNGQYEDILYEMCKLDRFRAKEINSHLQNVLAYKK